jgi:CDP-diacylglycerol--serine O-phosphatidyltransferase
MGVVIGVDPHKGSHMAVAIVAAEQQLEAVQVRSGPRQLEQLLGWAAGFMFVACTAMRLARFNIQSPGQSDKRYFVGLPSPPAAGIAAATVFAWPFPLTTPVRFSQILSETAPWQALAALLVMLVPAALMVSTIRFRSFKTINFGWGRTYTPLLIFAIVIISIYAEPRFTLLILSYGYVASAFIGLAWTRLQARHPAAPPPAAG